MKRAKRSPAWEYYTVTNYHVSVSYKKLYDVHAEEKFQRLCLMVEKDLRPIKATEALESTQLQMKLPVHRLIQASKTR